MIRMAFFGLSYREFSRAENIIKTDELYSEVFDIYLVQVNPKNRMGGGGERGRQKRGSNENIEYIKVETALDAMYGFLRRVNRNSRRKKQQQQQQVEPLKIKVTDRDTQGIAVEGQLLQEAPVSEI